jgi:DNA-binding SARP family transcriptional activator
MLDLIQQKALDQLHQLTPDIRLVIVHPNSLQQHRLLNPFLNEKPAVYVRFEGHGLSRSQLQAQLNAALETQLEGQALGSVRRVALDECDRALNAEFDLFLNELLNQLGSEGCVLLISRTVPGVIRNDDALRHKTRFIPSDKALMLPDYASQEPGKAALLEVRALGAGHVFLNGRVVDNWDGTLPRALFFYLVDRGMTTRGEIFETFWPNLSTREATNVFHVTKRKISEVLGIDLTVYWSGFYHISQQIDLIYDSALFAEKIQDSAVADTSEAAYLLASALELYRGDFLTSLDMPWVHRRRQELVQTYGEALIGLAKVKENAGEPRVALGYYLRAAVTNPQREDLARSIMTLYRGLHMPDDALRTYERLEDELMSKLGISPSKPLQELAEEIRAETVTTK